MAKQDVKTKEAKQKPENKPSKETALNITVPFPLSKSELVETLIMAVTISSHAGKPSQDNLKRMDRFHQTAKAAADKLMESWGDV